MFTAWIKINVAAGEEVTTTIENIPVLLYAGYLLKLAKRGSGGDVFIVSK